MDVSGGEADGAPSIFGGVKERVIVLVDAVRPVMTLEVVPKVLDGIEFRRVRRRTERRAGRPVMDCLPQPQLLFLAWSSLDGMDF